MTDDDRRLRFYLLLAELCRGKLVLDLQPGGGTGPALLTAGARTVVCLLPGAAEAAQARGRFGTLGPLFVVGDPGCLPVAAWAADVVLAGHADGTPPAAAVLHEARRVVRRDGEVALSACAVSEVLVQALFNDLRVVGEPGPDGARIALASDRPAPACPDGEAPEAGLWPQLLQERRAGDRLRAEADGLRADLARHAAELREARALAEANGRDAARQASQLAAFLDSRSWRLTGPLRGVGRRHPRAAGVVRAIGARHPRALRAALRTVRVAWRVSTLRPARAEAPDPPPSPPAPAPAPAAVPADTGRSFLFAGDTFDWLAAGLRLTGVGRVTSELMLAGGMALCDLAGEGEEVRLAPVPRADGLAYLLARTGRPPPPLSAPGRPATADPLRPGDHVLFTGASWSPSLADLFRRLPEAGLRVGVLVYDLIPVLHPELVDERHRTLFTAWLRRVAAVAETVFVPGAQVGAALGRWAALSGAAWRARIVTVPFGPTLPHVPPGRAPAFARPFVLSVGTIDRRKNQALLGRLWLRLLRERGAEAAPCLVLAGRDDLGVGADPAFAPLRRAGLLVLRSDVPDAELGALYRDCLFTMLPSRAEGYGLPVAESFDAGRLCLAADLPEVREHGADLAWYFDPADEDGAYALLCRALDEPGARAAAERRLAARPPRPGWDEAAAAMADAMRQPAPLPAPRPARPSPVPGPAADLAAAMRRAACWCVEDAPEVSILLVNWNSASLVLACVRQVWAATEGVRYEIVIADNGSDPASLPPLRALGPGVRVVELGINRFYGEANNLAADRARGRLICLLNTDAFVQPGWLPALRAALADDPGVGAAGPLFLHPDGTVQEAGGFMDAAGHPVRARRGLRPAAARLRAEDVDYVSAATLLTERSLFLRLGGFDLAYEPAYYEDADLCFRLRAAGRRVRFVPAARVLHVEGATTGENPAIAPVRDACGEINRAKFVDRWGAFLRSRSPANLPGPPAPSVPAAAAAGRRLAVFYTPYGLTPGGGERYLLTAASVLAADHEVVVATEHPYSSLRLPQLGAALGLDLSGCRVEAMADVAARPDLLVALGNNLVPPVPPRGRRNVFVCQFPFPLPDAALATGRANLAGYDVVVTYSDYVRAHVLAGMSARHLPPLPVVVVHPPVEPPGGEPDLDDRRGAVILSVGRFFQGGHAKRQDRLIEAFRRLREEGGDPGRRAVLHLAGSVVPEQLDYLAALRGRAGDLPVRFHANPTAPALAALFRSASLYWHAAGMDADLRAEPERAEHFGIAVAEAMAAGCVPLAFNAGGPREIVTDGTDGFLFDDGPALVARSCALLAAGPATLRPLRAAAACRAAAFSPARFAAAFRRVATPPG